MLIRQIGVDHVDVIVTLAIEKVIVVLATLVLLPDTKVIIIPADLGVDIEVGELGPMHGQMLGRSHVCVCLCHWQFCPSQFYTGKIFYWWTKTVPPSRIKTIRQVHLKDADGSNNFTPPVVIPPPK
jgi:hypothetical protein